MPRVSELKTGMIVEINDTPYIIKSLEVKSPTARGGTTLYKFRFNDLKTGQKLDEAYKGDDILKEVDCARIRLQFSYIDGTQYIFMDTENYSQYGLDAEDLEEQIGYLTEGLDGIVGLLIDDKVIAIELPSAVNLVITHTDPSIKGQTAIGRTKTAKLSTGIEIQVPEYIESGEVVKVNTLTGKFSSRA